MLTTFYSSAAVTNFPFDHAGGDPVAYFTQNKAVKGSSKYQSTYQGATYYFSSAADLATFKKNPSKYVPQYGGFRANGVKNNQLNDG